LERSLDKEKHQAKQWKSKKQKDLKLFYGVVQKAAAVCVQISKGTFRSFVALAG
jgi:hypothetical protein